MRGRRKLVYGVGVNDADYYVKPVVDGKRAACPFYVVWSGILRRCYSNEWLIKSPTYKGCSICEDWKVFSNFKSWMEKQTWEGMEIDKDILVPGNKVYSPENCAFVDSMTNCFMLDCGAIRGKKNVGFHLCKEQSKFRARCSNPFTGKLEFIGRFSSESEARTAWRKRKHELACQLADLQNDKRVAAALRSRYAD